MTQKQITARRERNRAIAVEDQKHRCPICHIALRTVPRTYARLGTKLIYCSHDCVMEARSRDDDHT